MQALNGKKEQRTASRVRLFLEREMGKKIRDIRELESNRSAVRNKRLVRMAIQYALSHAQECHLGP